MQHSEKNRDRPGRWPELDFVRGLAVLGMIFYHLLFDLGYFYQLPFFTVLLTSPAVQFLQILIGGSFIFISGLSAAVRFYQAEQQHESSAILQKMILKRSLNIGFAALVITIVTLVLFARTAVYFGILHFLAAASVISLRWRQSKGDPQLVLFALCLIIIGWWLNQLDNGFWWSMPLGWSSDTFTSLDYYPLLPWLGVFLLGIAVAKMWYIPHRALGKDSWLTNICFKPVNLLGRQALLVYLLHQPLLFLGLRFLLGPM